MSDNKLVLSQVHTVCKGCVFAKFDKNKQVGCKLDKLKDYENAGIAVHTAYDENDTEFYIIDGRFCMFYRNNQIMDRYPQDSWEDIVKLQTKVPWQAIVFIEKDSTFKEIKDIVKSIEHQYIKPNLITLVNKQYPYYYENPDDYIKPSILLEILNNSDFHQHSLKNVYDTSLSDRELVDLVFDSTKDKPIPFYITFRAGFNIPDNFIKEFNDAILIKMLQLGFVKPIDDLNGMIVARIAHKKHAGNSFGINLETKLENFEDNAKNFIYEVKDICPSMNK